MATTQQVDKDYQEYLKSKSSGAKETSLSKSTKKIKAQNIEKGKAFKEKFEASQGFKSKITLFNINSHGIKNNEDTANRYINMENVINAYTGDEVSIKQLDELLDTDSTQRMSLIIKQCLEEEIDFEKTEQMLFAELHGIDTSKLPDKIYTDEELINLSIIKEMCPSINISDFVGCSSSQLSIIAKAACQGINLGDVNLLSEFCILGSIEQTRENKDLNLVDIKIGPNKYAKAIIYEYDRNTENVEIFEETLKGERQLATVDINNKFISGTLENVKMVMIQSDIIQNLHLHDKDALSQEIEQYKEQTAKEAILNPMTKEERMQYNKEVEAAEEEHKRIIGGASSFLNAVN